MQCAWLEFCLQAFLGHRFLAENRNHCPTPQPISEWGASPRLSSATPGHSHLHSRKLRVTRRLRNGNNGRGGLVLSPALLSYVSGDSALAACPTYRNPWKRELVEEKELQRASAGAKPTSGNSLSSSLRQGRLRDYTHSTDCTPAPPSSPGARLCFPFLVFQLRQVLFWIKA